MSLKQSDAVSRTLREIAAGNGAARDELFALVFDNLRAIAARLMQTQPAGHTLQPTALVNEAAMRLLNDMDLGHGANRRLFYWTAARSMRRVLVDHARRRKTLRRGGDRQRVPLDATVEFVESSSGLDLLALDESLEELRGVNERQAEIVVLRFFGGLELKEIAEQLEVSLSTIEKDWRLARIWLRRKLS